MGPIRGTGLRPGKWRMVFMQLSWSMQSRLLLFVATQGLVVPSAYQELVLADVFLNLFGRVQLRAEFT